MCLILQIYIPEDAVFLGLCNNSLMQIVLVVPVVHLTAIFIEHTNGLTNPERMSKEDV